MTFLDRVGREVQLGVVSRWCIDDRLWCRRGWFERLDLYGENDFSFSRNGSF
jgi:hypothetical protein